MFSVVHGGRGVAWIGHLHHLALHQLSSPNRPITTNCTHKRCNTMVQCCQYHLKLEFWSHGCSQMTHPNCNLCPICEADWDMKWGLLFVPGTGYRLTIFKPLLHLLSHLDHVFFVNAKKINDFISSWHTSSTAWSMVVEWSLQTLFCSMTFHPTTNSITHWFPVATCNENPLCFDGKVLFMGT